MKAFFLFAITASILSLSPVKDYTINKGKSTLNWTGSAAFSAYSLSGTLKVKEGNLIIQQNKIISAKIIIDMKTLEAENSDLKKHLRSKDFFEVKRFKTATFEIDQPVEIKNGEGVAKGQLTIKGISQPFQLPLKFKESAKAINISGTVTVDRTKFGIYYNSPNYFKNLKQQAIADDFLLQFEVFFDKK